MKVKELFDGNPDRWTQGSYAIDKEGNKVPYDSEKARAWCLDGAISKCYGELSEEYWDIYTRINNKVDGYISWNDNPYRKFEEVKALVEELDI